MTLNLAAYWLLASARKQARKQEIGRFLRFVHKHKHKHKQKLPFMPMGYVLASTLYIIYIYRAGLLGACPYVNISSEV